MRWCKCVLATLRYAGAVHRDAVFRVCGASVTALGVLGIDGLTATRSPSGATIAWKARSDVRIDN